MSEPLFNKVAYLRPVTLLKKRLWHRCFPVNFAKFLRTPFFQNTSEQLLLKMIVCRLKAEKGRSKWRTQTDNMRG